MSETPKLPRRRIELDIHIGADDYGDVEATLQQLLHWWYGKADGKDTKFNLVSGSPSAGYGVSGDLDDSITHDSYFEAVEERKAARKAAAP